MPLTRIPGAWERAELGVAAVRSTSHGRWDAVKRCGRRGGDEHLWGWHGAMWHPLRAGVPSGGGWQLGRKVGPPRMQAALLGPGGLRGWGQQKGQSRGEEGRGGDALGPGDGEPKWK